jgi:hypothetical protein
VEEEKEEEEEGLMAQDKVSETELKRKAHRFTTVNRLTSSSLGLDPAVQVEVRETTASSCNRLVTNSKCKCQKIWRERFCVSSRAADESSKVVSC